MWLVRVKWDLYPQNLMAEYHIRYGGSGYYLLSDAYIALMSRFTTCGPWEGHCILDFLQENQSEVQPDTVHADTQGQSEAIFGLAYLLGIELQPRIRDWKGLVFYRPERDSRYDHIDALFTAQANWDLVEGMLPDMLRVAVSVQSGAILPSDILRRLGSYSRKNRLYFAFRELGRVVRTIFLLRYGPTPSFGRRSPPLRPRASALTASCSGSPSGATALLPRMCATNSAISSNTTTWWRTCWSSTTW
jgi:TnpA family transposase